MAKSKKIRVDELYFQYVPDEFFRDVYPGPEESMLAVSNSPHYKFLKLFKEIGDGIWDCYKETDYIKLMIYWGRDDRHNRDKVQRFINSYRSVASNGLKKKIIVSSKPVHKKFFSSGYEIWHGHHRAAICKALKYRVVKCIVMNKNR